MRNIKDSDELKLPLATRLPFLLVVIALGAATIFVAILRLSDLVAINPWEPAIAMEAVRLNSGLPIYNSAHATHMYGPLLTVTLAGIFRVTGLNLVTPRIVMSIGALALAIFLAVVFNRFRSIFWTTLVILLFLGTNFRTNLALVSAQPDCVAILIGSVALLIWAKSPNTVSRMIGSIGLFVAATFFKQTAAALALVPIVFILIWQRPVRMRDLMISTIPAAIIGLSLLITRVATPKMFHAIVTVPAAIQVHWEHVPGVFLYFIATFPILFVAVIAALSKQRPLDERDRWAVAALIVLIPTSVWAICKSGGSYNSLLPGYLALLALFVSRFDVVIRWIGTMRNTRAILASSSVALIVLLSFFVQFDRVLALLEVRHGDDNYQAAVSAARNLGGIVVSPQDPTIAYRATGYIGHSLIFELDKHAVNGNWPTTLPDSLLRELDAAQFIVQVRSFVPNPMFDRALPERGFSPMPVEALSNSVYTIWGKSRD